jgi:heptose II phosphotransferase
LKYNTQQYLGYNIHHFVQWDKAKSHVDYILNNEYNILKTLKDDQRSAVHLISLDKETIILKIPIEKNRRKWIRMLSPFRKSDALQSSLSMLLLQQMGIGSNKPLVVVEKKKLGVIVDSWYLCSFVEGSPCNDTDYQNVVETLQKIHAAGYLHGDPHLKNFLKGKEGAQVIDTKLSKSWNFAQKDLELAYLEKSCPATNQYFNTNTLSYKFAHFVLYQIQGRFQSIKKQIRKAFRS